MALATDANINRLQQMFPTVEGDVIAIVLNDCGNNGMPALVQLQETTPLPITHLSLSLSLSHTHTHSPSSQLNSVLITSWRLAELIHHLSPNKDCHSISGQASHSRLTQRKLNTQMARESRVAAKSKPIRESRVTRESRAARNGKTRLNLRGPGLISRPDSSSGHSSSSQPNSRSSRPVAVVCGLRRPRHTKQPLLILHLKGGRKRKRGLLYRQRRRRGCRWIVGLTLQWAEPGNHCW